MPERTIEVPRTARYQLMGTPSRDVEHLWIVCHGYGQLAGDFVGDFACIADERTLIVAPEALSRFYLRGARGKIGASWMTKESRDAEIADYCRYLSMVLREIVAELPSQPKLHVLGFSQGVDTACRWVCQARIEAEQLVLWGHPVTADLDLARVAPTLRRLRLSVVVGNADEFVSADDLSGQKQRLAAHAIPVRVIGFPGGHHLDRGILRELAGVTQ